MICKLCQDKEADKKNTHYLTDSIIRPCLNKGGTNVREKGYMFDVSNFKPFIEFNFQRETSVDSIVGALGREATEEEITQAKQNAFSVDNVFCKNCEEIFTSIEEEFTQKILPKLRGVDLSGISELVFADRIAVRKFFLLQVWRTSVCDPTFKISPTFQEKLRKIFYDETSLEEVCSIPLNITHLNTLGDDSEYTKNLVGIGLIGENNVIFFNDFIIQVFEEDSSIRYVDLYGINTEENFDNFTNRNEENFLIKVIENDKRVEIANDYSYYKEKAADTLGLYLHIFNTQYLASFGKMPSQVTTAIFMNGIICGEDCTDETRYTKERFIRYITSFLENLYVQK